MRKIVLLGLLATVLLPAARPRVRLGGVSAGYSYMSGYPWFWSPWYSPWYYGYDPFFYHPYYATGFAYGPGMGEIKLLTRDKAAEVYLDGAYAGTAGDLKNMWLEPGAYNLQVGSFQKRVYVLSGKTLRIRP